MDHADITVTSMGFSVKVNEKGDILGTSLGIDEWVKRFELWKRNPVNDNQWELSAEYFHFDKKGGRCYFPRYDLQRFLDLLKSRNAKWEIRELPPSQGVPAPFIMLPHVTYKNDQQKEAIEFLVNPDNGSVRGLALQTGKGKSVAFIWALQKLGVRSLITMTSRLEQWLQELRKYTTLEEDDIYIVQGVGSLTKLFTQVDTKISPKVILCSTKTMRLYLEYGPTYQHLPNPAEACEKLGVGIVGTDEYHEHYYSNFLINIILNPALFIPITATFLANDPFVKKIFDQMVPKDIQFTGGEYERYVNITQYEYNPQGYYIRPFSYMSPQGYSQQMFEKYLTSNKGQNLLERTTREAIIPIIRDHYINVADKGERLLFLCSSTKLCDYLAGVFKRKWSDKTVSVFYSGMPATILDRYDMILSTPGSSGTGRDVKHLRTCFVFESTKSEIRNTQFLGRLRGPPSMLNTPEFVTLSFSNIPQHRDYRQIRALLYGPLAKTLKHRTIP